MKTRIISSIILLPILIAVVYIGNIPLIITLLLATLIGLHELYKAVDMKVTAYKYLTMLLAGIVYLSYYFNRAQYLNIAIVVFVVVCLGIYAFAFPKVEIKALAYVSFASVYLVYLLLHILLVRSYESVGNWMVWLIFIVAFGSDTSAYFVGVNFGKHKLVPKLSPNKTVEGAIGGIIGAALLSTFFCWVMLATGILDSKQYMIVFFIVGAVGSLVSQIGDLVGSAMKRQTGIKDFGHIIPGHGGILDRLDSILLTSAYVYLVLQVFFVIQ